ncbi:MAG: hypothetical protein C5B59_17140 [Bacteroidetes bacterium]|nr:MAG: hypothetical protein C5B59_17140 [Bacteroidota bacterium]
MLLHNAHVAWDAAINDIFIENEKIKSIIPSGGETPAKNELIIDLDQSTILPGFINSHDHLDFNLFSSIKNRIYNNYTEWGKDIHQNNKNTIDAVLKIPKALRIQAGLYKNLLNGITTVINHGEKLEISESPIDVFQHCISLHSVHFEKLWILKVNLPRSERLPIVMHVGEGTDQLSREEINQLIQWNFFKKEIIAVHGVAMNEMQASHFKALVWCPASNFYLLNSTARIDILKNKIPILFGMDSTLTSSWNLWEHLRLAKKQAMLDDAELLNSLTTNAATVWGLKHFSKVEPGNRADLVAMKKTPEKSDLFSLNPEDILLVLHRGEPRLIDESIYSQFAGLPLHTFSKIYVNGQAKYVQGDLQTLVRQSRKYYPQAQFPFEIA